jgi:hypothetical protein
LSAGGAGAHIANRAGSDGSPGQQGFSIRHQPRKGGVAASICQSAQRATFECGKNSLIERQACLDDQALT